MKALNARLGLLLALLGFGAFLIGSPGSGGTVTIDSQELARLVQTETDHVSAEELADWIVEGRNDFRLLDLRTEEEYKAYHIPGAENVPITGLAGYGLQRNEKIVLYSEGGIHSAQAWFLLKAKEYRGVSLLRGGLDAWKEVLFPRIPDTLTAEQKTVFEKRGNVSRFFGGTPVTGSVAGKAPESAGSMPALTMPPAPAGGAKATGPKAGKKKEGC